MKNLGQQKGFSLIEILTVIVIISILAAIAALSVFEAIREGTVSRERDLLVAAVQEAKARSISSRPSGIRFAGGGGSYDIIVMKGNCSTTSATLCNGDTDCPATEYCSMGAFRYDGNISRITVLSTHSPGTGITVGWTRLTGSGNCASATDNILWFDRKGIPRCANWGLGMTSLTVTMAGSTKKVSIDEAGRVKYEN